MVPSRPDTDAQDGKLVSLSPQQPSPHALATTQDATEYGQKKTTETKNPRTALALSGDWVIFIYLVEFRSCYYLELD